MFSEQCGMDRDRLSVHADRVLIPRQRHATWSRRCGLRAEVPPGQILRRVNAVHLERHRGLSDCLVRLRMLRQSYEGPSRAQDARLLSRDLADGVAQVVLVVERDVGEYGDCGVHYVGGVESSAQADFEDSEFHPLLGEVEEA